MSDLQAIADRVEIEALRGEFTDAVMMRDYDRVTSLFTPDGALRMPNVPVELVGWEEIRAWGHRALALWDFFVQTTHPGTIQLDGDTASGRAYMCELIRLRNGHSELNYAIYHDRYQRTPGSPLDGWLHSPAAIDFLRQGYDPFSPDGPGHFPVVYAKTMAMIDAEPELDLATLGAVPAPTLVLQGDRDEVTLEHGAAVAAALPDARLAVLPGSHALPLELPGVVNPLLITFLRGTMSASALLPQLPGDG